MSEILQEMWEELIAIVNTEGLKSPRFASVLEQLYRQLKPHRKFGSQGALLNGRHHDSESYPDLPEDDN